MEKGQEGGGKQGVYEHATLTENKEVIRERIESTPFAFRLLFFLAEEKARSVAFPLLCFPTT